MEKAKRQIESNLVLSHEEPLQQAILLGQYETIAIGKHIPAESRGYLFLESFLDRIRAVKPDDVARVARKYLTEDNRTVGYLVNETDKVISTVETKGEN
jgi:zinc protease